MGKVDISGLIAIQLNRHVRIRVSDHVYAMVRRGCIVGWMIKRMYKHMLK